MSSSLYWRPLEVGGRLPNEIKNVVTKEYKLPQRLTNSDVQYFKALKDADIKGAEEILKLIYDHGEFELYLEY